MLRRVTCVTLTVLALATPAFAQPCLHGSTETPEQAARRKEALTATRNVNNLEANQPGANNGAYLRHSELASSPFFSTGTTVKKLNLTPGQDLLPGWELTLDVNRDRDGYWFMVKDKPTPAASRISATTPGSFSTRNQYDRGRNLASYRTATSAKTASSN